MSFQSRLFYFTLYPEAVFQQVESKADEIADLCIGTPYKTSNVLKCGSGGGKLIVYTNDIGSDMTIRWQRHGCFSLDINDFCKTPPNRTLMRGINDETEINELKRNIERLLQGVISQTKCLMQPIRRGFPWNYMLSGNCSLIELDHDEIVFEKRSKWQDIQIAHSSEFGKVLFLDGDVMIGESDLVYTQSLLGIGRNDFKDKSVLILGGGDGGVIHELLKEEPKFVLMAELDIEVVDACRTHMRSVCGDTMDKLEGPNYKIHIGDCLQVMKNSIAKGETFDYIVNDLTEELLEEGRTVVSELDEELMSTLNILEMALKLLAKDGKILLRGDCTSTPGHSESIRAFSNERGLEMNRCEVFVPSFRERYNMYEIWGSHPMNATPVVHSS